MRSRHSQVRAARQRSTAVPLKRAVEIESLSRFGHRTWLHGLDALPSACRLVPACPRSSLRSGKRLLHALSAHRSSHRLRRGLATCKDVCPSASGPGTSSPGSAVAALWGPLTNVRTLPGSPIVHPPAWGLTDCYGRLPYAAVPVLFGPWGPARSIRRSSASLPLARILPPVV